MNPKSKIALNFSALKQQEFEFVVYRKKRSPRDKRPNDKKIFGSRLPSKMGEKEFENYWVSFTEFSNSQKFLCTRDLNKNLTKSFILWQLKELCHSKLPVGTFESQTRSKYRRLYFILENHNEGKEAIWLEPYYLAENNQYGFLIDYKFLKSDLTRFNRKIQELSLSLNSIGRSNTSFYSDKYSKIRKFARLFYKKIFQNSFLDFEPLSELTYQVFQQKIFLIKDNIEVNAQNEMRKIGPLKSLSNTVNIYFLHKDSERKILVSFYEELVKELKSVFNADVNLHGHKCNQITATEIQALVERIKSENYSNPVVIVLKKNREEEDELYYSVKYKFCQINVPVQFINYDTLKNKYSVRDFSLQIFSKVGGIPWKIKAIDETTLLVGLAQSIRFKKIDERKVPDRYYAYSILLESTGLYHSIDIISSNNSKESYLKNLRQKIVKILNQHSKAYSRIAIHAPFKISRDEVSKIREAIERTKPDIEFVVIRINTSNKYFGYNKELNNLTPLEGSCVRISHNQYLLWVEGLKTDNFKPRKRYSGPIFVEFMLQNKEEIDHFSYLQELLSLSGMNWRAYNSKSTPISVQYCDLVTEFVREFRERQYPELEAASLQPWFL